MPSDAADPHAEYRHRLADRKAVAAARSRRHALCGNARLAVVLAAAALAWMSLAGGWLSPYWLALPAVAFLALTFVQDRARRAWRRAERAVAFYERGLARLEHRWSGGGQPGTRFLDPDHPYALDLDLFGPGSLFELLCTARTRHGEDTLAEWLLAPTDPDTVRARQAAVADLRPRLDLREELSLQGAVVPGGVELSALAAWGAAPPALPSRLLRLAALLLALLALAALLGWWLLDLGPTPFLVAVILEAGFALALRRRVEQVIGPVDRRSRDLALLAGLLSRLEREEFTAPRLRELQAALLTDGLSPSGQIARLAALVELLDSRKNIYFAPLASLLLWGTQLAFAIEAWRGRAGKAIGRWLEGVGEFEALCALSAFAYENPADPFPEVLAEGPVYDGEGLGHPLIPAGRCVPNDVRLGGELRLLVISGS
ncbi:MAG TPA: hypothetical protein VFA26_18875, partial [Gemmataceae bacterium]|nr:hypothetical protein [Gemmataceae bacterium]